MPAPGIKRTMTRPPMMREQRRQEHGFTSIYALAFDPHTTMLACGGDDLPAENQYTATSYMLRLLDVATGHELRQFGSHSAPVTAVAFSPNGLILASACLHQVTLWEVSTGRELWAITGEHVAGQVVAFSPDGATIATAGSVTDHSIALWDATTGKERRRLIGHAQDAEAVAFNGDGTLLGSGSHDGTLRLWLLPEGQEVAVLTQACALRSVTFSPDGMLVAAGDVQGVITVWDIATRRQLWTLVGPSDHAIYSLAFNPDGTLLAGAYGDEYSHSGAALIWRVPVDGWRTAFAGATGAVIYAVAISSEGHTLASAGDEDLQWWQI